MKAVITKRLRQFFPVQAAIAAITLLPGLSAEVSAAGYTVESINGPGAALSMSSAGYLTGTYKVKCSKIQGTRPILEVCYYAPWIYDGRNIIKVQWPVDWNYVYSFGINDSLELVGREYRGSVSAGGWLYSGGEVFYSGSLPDGGGSLLNAINNDGVAVGTAQKRDPNQPTRWIGRAATFQNTGGSNVLEEVSVFDSDVPTTGADINDEGDITGTYTAIDGAQHAYVYQSVNGAAISIPDLPGASYCQGVSISQVVNSGQLWVAGNCGDRGFLYNVGEPGQLIELNNLDGQSGGVAVKSVNGWGEAVGTVAGKAVTWASDNTTAIDLNQYASRHMTFSRGNDINDDGIILVGDVDPKANLLTYILTPTP